MIRFAATAIALAASATLLIPIAAHAQAPVGFYVAVPAAGATKTDLMTHDTPWQLRDGAYTAARAPERDAVLCELVAKDVGKLQSFSVGGKPYDADAMAKCNAKAK